MRLLKKIILTTAMTLLLTGMFALPANATPKMMANGLIFDADFYYNAYPDVAAAFGHDETALFNHYWLCGIYEGRLPVGLFANMPFTSNNISYGNIGYSIPGQTIVQGTTVQGLYYDSFTLSDAELKYLKKKVDDHEKLVDNVVGKINDYRSGKGLKKLKQEYMLDVVATYLANENYNAKSNGGTRPNGKFYSSVLKSFGYSEYDTETEIHFKYSDDNASEVLQEMLDEDEDAVLDEDYRYVGIGHVGKYWIAIFMDDNE